MNQRLVLIVGGLLAAALVAFAVWHAYQPRPATTTASESAAPTSAPPPTPAAAADETAGVPRMEPDALLAHFKAGDVTILDVRDADSFLASHIPGSLHIPLARVEGEVPYLPKGKPIVAYCT
jgi:3-mercaptopyruvate sulfurtransferase SseA